MPRRLPPLNALRAFETAARHASFTRAAAELNVTQGAVSQQVRLLEDWLGHSLFRRNGRTLQATEAAERLLPELSRAFDGIAQAVAPLRRERRGGVLNVSVLPTFVARWMIPRLARWQARHPEIDLRFSVSFRAVDLAREDFDAAIRHGQGGWPGLHAEALFSEEIVPVCAPALLAAGPFAAPGELLRHTLLHDALEPDDWALWFAAAGLGGADAARGLGFETTTLAVQAAAEGLGIALGRRPFVDRDIADGRLAVAYDLALAVDSTYYLVCLAERLAEPAIAAFRGWVLDEVRAGKPAALPAP